MDEAYQDDLVERQNGSEFMSLGMYEAGNEGEFHVFNVAPDHYHRSEALQRTGAVDITCTIEKVVHGALTPGSDYYATLMVMQWTVGVEQVGQLSLTGKWEKTITTTTSDAITLSGGKRLVKNMPPYRIARWVVSENKSQPAGIPASLKVAVLISRDDEERFRRRLALDCKTDVKTKVESFSKKIPKDDPIIFQPNPEDEGTRFNKSVTYGNENLESVNLDDLSDVTFRRIISDGQKTWK